MEDPGEYEVSNENAGWCYTCDGTGIVMICPDDLCHGVGECMHGDGEIACPDGCDLEG